MDRKICTTCLAEKPSTEFYRKGSQLDSKCKECKRAARRATYVSQKNDDSFSRVKQLLDVFNEAQLSHLDRQLIFLEELFNKVQKRQTGIR